MSDPASSTRSVILMGPPACGKSFLSTALKANGFHVIGTGKLLRAEVTSQTALGFKVAAIMACGELIDDATMVDYFSHHLRQTTSAKLAFDGFPRSLAQAKILDRLLALRGIHEKESRIIHMQADESFIQKLLKERLTKAIQNGTPIRCDDTPDLVKVRFAIYRHYAKALTDYYGPRLSSVDAMQTKDAVLADTSKLLGLDLTRRDSTPRLATTNDTQLSL